MGHQVDSSSAEKVCHIRKRIAGRIGENRFRTWFGNTTEFSLDGHHLAVTVENPFVSNWITSNFMDHLVAATREVIGAEPRVAVRVSRRGTGSAGAADPPPLGVRTGRPAAEAPRTRARPTLRGTLDTFVVGPSNQLAYSAAGCIVRSPGADFRLLVIHGGCGLGKTHLLQGICNGVLRAHPALEWRYLSGEEFTNEFVSALKCGHIDAFRARFRKVDLLAIDDIHFLANKKGTQEEFLHTFNAIDAHGKTIVLSSDRHPRDIATLSEPLINRLIAGMVVQIDPPDFTVRREILRRRAENMNVSLPDDVLDFLARRITRNVRELEGALYKLVALATLTKRPLNLEMARVAAEEYADRTARAPALEVIERVVANYFAVSREAIHSPARGRTITLARGVAMYLARRHTGLSFPEIGRRMGNKNHSTVLMAVRRIETLLDQSGAVTWRTPSGVRQMPLRAVLDELARELARSAAAAQ